MALVAVSLPGPFRELQAGGPSLCTTCWESGDAFGCCTDFPWLWATCNGQPCSPQLITNDLAANAQTTCDGWNFAQLDRMWVDCIAKQAGCDWTQNPPVCTVSPHEFRDRCALYTDPAGEETCHE